MQTKRRIFLAVISGTIGAVLLWFGLLEIYPKFGRMNYISLIQPIMSGIFGGIVVSSIIEKRKIFYAFISSLLLVTPLMAFILRNGLSDFGRNPILWYWPLWLIPSFVVGGVIGYTILKSHNKAQQNDLQ